MVHGLDNRTPQTVHNRQALSHQQEDNSPNEKKSQNYFILHWLRSIINPFLKAAGKDIKGQYDFNSESKGSTDQDDELHFIYAFNDIVQLSFHHDAGHLEAEIEESHQKWHNNYDIQPDIHRINHRKTQLIHIVHY